MQPNEIYNILTLKKMYLRKDSQLVSFSFPFSLIKKIKRPGKVPGEGLSKQKLFELSGNLEYLFQRAPLSTDRKARHPLVLTCSLPLFQFQLLECFSILLFSLLNCLTTVLLKCHQQASYRSAEGEAEGMLRGKSC